MNQRPLEPQQFLADHHLPPNALELIPLQWGELMAIYDDHSGHVADLETTAALIASTLQRLSSVHSLHYRVKDPIHLVAKIIRKIIQNPNRYIALENYRSDITDLIGVRALHLFKRDWAAIHNFLLSKWDVAEIPTAYVRNGDPDEIITQYKQLGCEVKQHSAGYRSVHYLIKCAPGKEAFIAEIQVRSLFEEGWAEIDHRIRYPTDVVSPMLRQQLVVFNRLAGSADEMGSFAMFMKEHIEGQDRIQKEVVAELESRYEELRSTATGSMADAEFWGLRRKPNQPQQMNSNPRSTTMEPISIKDAARVLEAKVSGTPRWTSNSVSIDSRTATQNCLFFALRGQFADGHEHINEVFSKGAAGAVVDHEITGAGGPQLIVPDTVAALGKLAQYYRDQFDIPVVGVTGSIGKTSTKEMLSCVLGQRYVTLVNEKNYNTEIGVPLTLFNLERVHEVAVVEMGMRGVGQIGQLASIARPSIGVITNIGMSHIELLGNRETIAEAKGELLDGMDETGVSVLNRDDDFFEVLRHRSKGQVLTFGKSAECDFQVTDLRYSSQGRPIFKINGIDFHLLATGVHHPINAAAVCAVAHILGLEIEEVACGLERFTPPPMRGNVLSTPTGAIILNDTYNAAPDSMTSALQTLCVVAKSQKRRPVAVLGEMRELGSHSIDAHRLVGDVVKREGVELLVTVGPDASEIGARSGLAGDKLHGFPDSATAAKNIEDLIKENDIVLVKGSREVYLDQVVQALGATDIEWKGYRPR